MNTIKAKLTALTILVVIISIISATAISYEMYLLDKSFNNVKEASKLEDTYKNLLTNGLQTGQALRNLYIDNSDNKAKDNINRALLKLDGDIKVLSEIDKDNCKDIETSYSKYKEHTLSLTNNITSAQKQNLDENTKIWRVLKDGVLKQISYSQQNVEKQREVMDSCIGILKIVSLIVFLIIILVVGSLVAKVSSTINNNLASFQQGLNSFFDFLNRKSSNIESIKIKSEDEFAQMAKTINANTINIKKRLEQDSLFILSMEKFAREFGAGKFFIKVEANTDSPELIELKKVLDKMQYDIEHNVCRDLGVLLEILYKFKNNDFTAHFPNAYGKVAVAINELGNTISTMLTKSLDNGVVLQQNSVSLKESVADLLDSAIQQSTNIEETASAMEEITSNVQTNASKASLMNIVASDASKATQDGAVLAEKTKNAMDEIQKSTQSINQAVSVIENIAFQTNILSLNAAVEAATAGEAGKGFAVVAQEVRNLANRSADAAKTIKSLVDQANKKTSEGYLISEEMTKSFELIADKIRQTSEMATDVTNSSAEQMSSIEQINDSIIKLDKIIQSNTQNVTNADMIALQTEQMAQMFVNDANSKNFIHTTKNPKLIEY